MSASVLSGQPGHLGVTAGRRTLRLSHAAPYPERDIPQRGVVEEWLHGAVAQLPRRPSLLGQRALRRVAAQAAADRGWAAEALGIDGGALACTALATSLRRSWRPQVVGRALAFVREVAALTLGMRPYDVQIMAAAALLQGQVAEMQTGEGKTLAAALAAAVAGLAGRRVHVITVNDYLAQRDGEALVPFFARLGLRAGFVVHETTPEARRVAYAAPVTYVSNKEVAFDYLRDAIRRRAAPTATHQLLARLGGTVPAEALVMRGLDFAITDEADSVLVDEARTPLIISGEGPADADYARAQEALALVTGLVQGEDYLLDRQERRVDLTKEGQRRIAAQTEAMGPDWGSVLARSELVRRALSAQFLFERDVHYLVRDDKVQIIDEYTGRIMADRFWNDGLQQMVEAKEGCAPSRARTSIARITYQKFFARYRHLCGMSGTLAEIAPELRAVYGLEIARIPTHRPSRRIAEPAVIVPDATAKWQLIAARALELAQAGRPVLIGTRSVAASDRASRLLHAAGMDHALLNAAQDAKEAAVVAQAGNPGRVTVATNMAGRGTDIRLGTGVAERGGLAVIVSERHDAARIDRQLAGRCARQGEPGSLHVILSLEDALLDPLRLHTPGRLLLRLAAGRPGLARGLFTMMQKREERRHRQIRQQLMRFETRMERAMSFAGRPD